MYAITITPDGTTSTIDFPEPTLGSNQYRIMSDAVGGYIERVGITAHGREYDMWVNEEGLLRHLPYNSIATYLYEKTYDTQGLIVGNAIILKSNNDGDTLPLLMADVEWIMAAIKDYEGALQ